MEFKKNANNKKIIDWKAYKEELKNRKEQDSFNECKSDLHTMTMKEGAAKNLLSCPKYNKVLNEMMVFDQTDFDYYRYEKELTLGEFND